MLELIQQNSLVSVILLLVPCIGIAWKVFDALYVKPRDFRIAVLEKNVDELRKEFQRTPAISTEVIPCSIEPSPSSIASPATQQAPVETIEELVQGTTVLNDVSAFHEAWKKKSLTELQRDQFENNYLGQKVVWRMRLGDVSEERDGLLWVSLTSPKERDYGVHVIAVFESKYKEALLMLKKGEIVTVSGVIERFSLSPLIRVCNIVRDA